MTRTYKVFARWWKDGKAGEWTCVDDSCWRLDDAIASARDLKKLYESEADIIVQSKRIVKGWYEYPAKNYWINKSADEKKIEKCHRRGK